MEKAKDKEIIELNSKNTNFFVIEWKRTQTIDRLAIELLFDAFHSFYIFPLCVDYVNTVSVLHF